MLLQMALFHSFSWLSNISLYMCHSFFICSAVDGHLAASMPRPYFPIYHCIHVNQGPSPLVSRRGASRDSTGLGALEEGLISSWGRNLRVPLISDSDRRNPADWGQESQASSWVEAWNSACLSRCPRRERPLVELYLEPGVFFRTRHGRVTAPSC